MTANPSFENLKPLSPKARASIKADGWMTVWEGAIRSGKTVASLIAWLAYVCRSRESVFFMSGKTYSSLVRNTILGDFGLLELGGGLVKFKKDLSGAAVLSIGYKTIYLFGACDDAAYTRVKGLTAGGWYADEVATHPQSFIVEALARTAVSTDRRIFWTLNPTVPNHYIYKSFLDVWEEAHVEGYRRYHFTLDDNLAMPPERRAELELQYTGRYRIMYILGLRSAAEGVVYDMFSRKRHVYSGNPYAPLTGAFQRYIACDYGTINPCVFLECQLCDGIVYVTRELRWDSRKEMRQKTDNDYIADMRGFIGDASETDCQIIVDPSAASFITALKMEGYFVLNGKNDVIAGIRLVCSLLSQNRIRIHESCTGLIGEMESYIWDERASQNGLEKPVKTNDHAPDALRYFCMTGINVFDL